MTFLLYYVIINTVEKGGRKHLFGEKNHGGERMKDNEMTRGELKRIIEALQRKGWSDSEIVAFLLDVAE